MKMTIKKIATPQDVLTYVEDPMRTPRQVANMLKSVNLRDFYSDALEDSYWVSLLHEIHQRFPEKLFHVISNIQIYELSNYTKCLIKIVKDPQTSSDVLTCILDILKRKPYCDTYDRLVLLWEIYNHPHVTTEIQHAMSMRCNIGRCSYVGVDEFLTEYHEQLSLERNLMQFSNITRLCPEVSIELAKSDLATAQLLEKFSNCSILFSNSNKLAESIAKNPLSSATALNNMIDEAWDYLKFHHSLNTAFLLYIQENKNATPEICKRCKELVDLCGDPFGSARYGISFCL